jgi:hypothetical protein
LPNDGIKDFSKHEKAFGPSVGEVIGSRSISRLSAAARSPLLLPCEEHHPPRRRLPTAERRPSGNSSTDPD